MSTQLFSDGLDFRARSSIAVRVARYQSGLISARELEHAVSSALAEDINLRHRLEREGDFDTQPRDLLRVVTRVQIGETHLMIETSLRLGASPITITAPYALRRRGVESKIILGLNAEREMNKVMVRRILRANAWVDQIKSGRPISEIARDEQISPEYITHNIDLAYLSPKVLTAILSGKQRAEISAYQLSKVSIPATWDEQDRLFLS